MYKYASAEFFRKEHTLRKATAPREAGDEVNGPSPTAGWGAVDPGHSHVWVTDVRGRGGRREMGCRGTRDRVEEMGVVLQTRQPRRPPAGSPCSCIESAALPARDCWATTHRATKNPA